MIFVNIGIFFSLLLFLIGYLFTYFNLMLISILVCFSLILVYSILHKQNSVILFGFLIAFFTFLLGEYTVRFLKGEKWFLKFDAGIMKIICLCVFISLLAIYIGFICAKSTKLKNDYAYKLYKEHNKNIQKTSLILFYITVFFQLIKILEPVIFVQNSTYLSLYTTYKSQLPYFVHKLAQANNLLYIIFLVTLPNKDKVKLPTLLYFGCNFITLFSGVRGPFVKSLLFIFMYLLYRNNLSKKYNENQIWLKKSWIATGIICLPFFIVFLSLYNSLRNNVVPDFNNFLDEFLKFFQNQGGSVNIIGYAVKMESQLPDTNTSYFFGPIISLYRYGFWSDLFGNSTALKNLLDVALYGNNLGATITYLLMPYYYLNGGGLGTQYIAECYVDFGYMGVIIFNFFVGMMLKKMNFVVSKNWFINAIWSNVIIEFLSMPRNFALTFVSPIISIFNWLIILLVYILSHFVAKSCRQEISDALRISESPKIV